MQVVTRIVRTHLAASALAVLGAIPVAQAQPAEDHLFAGCDNGIRCIRAPCPTRDVVGLPSGTRHHNVEIDVSGLALDERNRPDLARGLYDGSIVFAGSLVRGMKRVGELEMVTLKVRATAIARTATPEERSLCRGPPG